MIIATNVTKSFGKLKALDDVNSLQHEHWLNLQWPDFFQSLNICNEKYYYLHQKPNAIAILNEKRASLLNLLVEPN